MHLLLNCMNPYEIRLDMLVDQWETLRERDKLTNKHKQKLESWIDYAQRKLEESFYKEELLK